tara:strand:+ start:1683 stop:1997 length:315 start_codon:yes stop_codon:yes gene_type:complete
MTTTHNNHSAQIAYRTANAALDAADAAYEAADANNADEIEAAELQYDAAWSAEYQAGTALIEWAWSILQTMPNADQARPAVDAALRGQVAPRRRVIALALQMTA